MGSAAARKVWSTLTRQASERSADREHASLGAHARIFANARGLLFLSPWEAFHCRAAAELVDGAAGGRLRAPLLDAGTSVWNRELRSALDRTRRKLLRDFSEIRRSLHQVGPEARAMASVSMYSRIFVTLPF